MRARRLNIWVTWDASTDWGYPAGSTWHVMDEPQALEVARSYRAQGDRVRLTTLDGRPVAA